MPDGEDFDKWEACIVCAKPELVRETHTKAFRIVRLGVRKARYGIGRGVRRAFEKGEAFCAALVGRAAALSGPLS